MINKTYLSSLNMFKHVLDVFEAVNSLILFIFVKNFPFTP